MRVQAAYLSGILWTLLPSFAWAGHEAGHYKSGLGTTLLLVTLAIGYWVLRTSKSDTGWLRWIGWGAGWVILIASLGGLVCKAYHTLRYARGHHLISAKECSYCSYHHKGDLEGKIGKSP